MSKIKKYFLNLWYGLPFGMKAADKISYEVVFSYLFQELSDHVLLSYIDDSVEKGVLLGLQVMC